MIDPLILSIIQINTIVGIISIYSACIFQVYRKEKKSALVLFCLATALTATIIGKRLFVHI